MAAGVQELPGALAGLPSVPSQGSGAGGGAGTGTGTGIGPGDGSGLGDGKGGGTGGGVYRPGNGVMLAERSHRGQAGLHRRRDARQDPGRRAGRGGGAAGRRRSARSGSPGRSTRRSASIRKPSRPCERWRFRPGTRFGQPVPVLVEIEMTFTLR